MFAAATQWEIRVSWIWSTIYFIEIHSFCFQILQQYDITLVIHICRRVRKVCHNKKPNGEPCSEDSDCLSGRYPSNFPNKCKPLAGPGQGCANNKDCIDGYYCPFVGLNRKCSKRRKNRSTSAGWNY